MLVSFSLDIRRIFTRVQPRHYGPVLAAGGQLAHLPEPHAESLETDFGTYAVKTQLLWTLLASQADRGASADVVTEDRDAAVQRGKQLGWRQIRRECCFPPSDFPTSEIYMLFFFFFFFYLALSWAIETRFRSHCNSNDNKRKSLNYLA